MGNANGTAKSPPKSILLLIKNTNMCVTADDHQYTYPPIIPLGKGRALRLADRS